MKKYIIISMILSTPALAANAMWLDASDKNGDVIMRRVGMAPWDKDEFSKATLTLLANPKNNQ